MFIESINFINLLFHIIKNIETEHLIYVFRDCGLHLREDYYCPSQSLFTVNFFSLFFDYSMRHVKGMDHVFIPKLTSLTPVGDAV